MEVSGYLHTLAALHFRKTASSTPGIGYLVDPRDSLDVAVKKKSNLAGS
jgi:hypothetical protein